MITTGDKAGALTQHDWDWLEKLAMIYHRPASNVMPLDIESRLLDVGFVRRANQGQINITAAGRKAIKARDSGEHY